VAVTAVDTSIMLDVLSNDPRFGRASVTALRAAVQRGRVIACAVVWAEVRAHFERAETMRAAFDAAGIGFDPLDSACAELAGEIWRDYRRRGGRRTTIIPDFLIGAHARLRADALVSRDRGFLRRCFPDLVVIDPAMAR
jgi:predicted nucleic acid-binding protein